MGISEAATTHAVLSDLPSVDELLRTEEAQMIAQTAGPGHTADLARAAVASLRAELLSGGEVRHSAEHLLADAIGRLEKLLAAEPRASLKRVINATGVIIHTNLGRAPLSDDARRAVAEAAGYTNVEYDLETGARGRRGRRTEELAAEIAGADSALIVNNCAAAAFLVLSVFAAGGEVIVSRGELVEIGGDFRVPDVLTQSGATLREVGTTNRTKLADFQRAITDATRMILRVHPSNYRIVGFTAMPGIAELAVLAKNNGVLLYEDVGSGAMLDLAELGLGDEPLVSRSIREGADLVTFSGDKLLGGPQSGIIAGRRDLIDRVRKHPLYRALRVDKLIYAALEATLLAYQRGTAMTEIPVLRMLAASNDGLIERTADFAEQLKSAASGLIFEIISGESAVGGGAGPNFTPATSIISLRHEKLSADTLESRLRGSDPPVIARIESDRVLIDLRTVDKRDENDLMQALIAAA